MLLSDGGTDIFLRGRVGGGEGGDKNLVGGESTRGHFSKWGEMSKFLASGRRASPSSDSRENPRYI